MQDRPVSASPGQAAPLRALTNAARELGSNPDLNQGLWQLVCAIREDLGIDRAGVFAFDRAGNRLDRLAGVDRDGRAEFEGEVIDLHARRGPLVAVALRELPYYHTLDAPADYPDVRWAPGVGSLAVLPILAGDELIGALAVDNALSGRPIPLELLDPLFIFAGLAALPLFARHQRREREREEEYRRRVHRDVLYSATGGKILLCEAAEIDAEWPLPNGGVLICEEIHVRTVREEARRHAHEAGMETDRAEDFALCASESATNALLHGQGGTAIVTARDGRLRIRVTDGGEGIHPEDLPKATLLKGWSGRASLGLGFTVINEIADRIFLHTSRRGTTVIIEMAVEPLVNLPEECNPLLWGEEIAF
jgi:anti-sigma regulatory factor (Ser/Thr protein kinase)